jgi:hypothetical protein
MVGQKNRIKFRHNPLMENGYYPIATRKRKMPRITHYSPVIRRNLVRVLYHERRRRGIPMTKLVDEILTSALKSSESWRFIEEPTPEGQTNDSFV